MDDPRFTHIRHDPRFKSMSKKDKKVLLDGRFKDLLKTKRFSTKPKFDQYGHKTRKDELDELKDHYEVAVEDDEEAVEEQSDAQDEDDIEDDYTSEEEEEIDQGPDDWEEEAEKAPEMDQATHRLALQNYDWQVISAKDLMVLFNSFVPSGGAIKRVYVYQSNFGKERMKEEQEYGPRSIFKDTKANNSLKAKSATQEINQLIVKGGRDDLDIDPERLRQYERDRLRYYYAIIECDSAKTADAIYQNCNGQEFELSNLRIDLRFVPDDMKFEDKPYQQCDSITQLSGTKQVLSRAIGHTDVKLTWDEHIPKTNFWVGKTEEELEKIDWSEYIAGLDEPEEGAEEVREKLFANEDNVQDWKKAFDKKRKNKFDIEITFNQGFQEGGNAILDKERPKKNKSRFAQKQTDDDFFVGFEEQPQDEGKKVGGFRERKQERREQLRQKRAEKQKASNKERDELELLVDKSQKKTEQVFNPNDRRFTAIYDNPEYALDPTDRHFNRELQSNVFEEQVRRKKIKKNNY